MDQSLEDVLMLGRGRRGCSQVLVNHTLVMQHQSYSGQARPSVGEPVNGIDHPAMPELDS